MMLAVLRPTPGSVTSASIVRGTWPPNSRVSLWQQAMMFLALLRKKPVVRISCSKVFGSASAYALADGYFRKRWGVTWFTRASVHWAERIVATRSSNGVEKLSSHRASGYDRVRISRNFPTFAFVGGTNAFRFPAPLAAGLPARTINPRFSRPA